jgi:Fur family transcriptional regulator, peroxide stress response regulator
MSVNPNELQRRLDSFKEACREAGIKVTHQRLEIFREVARSNEHPDARTVLKGVRKRIPEVSLDTVYRTLWLLKDLGMIGTLGTNVERTLFDANMSRHHHFVCVQCGIARDFYNPLFDELEAPDSIKEFGDALTTHVEVRGICSRCSNKPNKKCAQRKKGEK